MSSALSMTVGAVVFITVVVIWLAIELYFWYEES